MSFGMRDLYVGGRYQRGRYIRTIEKISGDDVHWRDDDGFGVCTKQVFIKKCDGFAIGYHAPPKPTKRASPIASISNLAQIAALFSSLLNQHTQIARAIQPLLARMDSPIRQEVSLDLLKCLTTIEDWRRKFENAIAGGRYKPDRKIILSMFQQAEMDVALTGVRHAHVSRSVLPFFGSLGENERLSATQALSDHSSSLTHLRSELAAILS